VPDLGRWQRHTEYPGVPDVLLPVLVVPEGDTLLSPTFSPGVLDQESITGVANDGKGMPTERFSLDRDPAVSHKLLVPTTMHPGRDENGSHLVQSSMEIGDPVTQPEVGTQGVLPGLFGPADGQFAWVRGAVAPEGVTADPHRVPALNGTAAAGARVPGAWPFVMPLGHLVEHTGTDIVTASALMIQQIDHRRRAKPGAGPFAALIQDL